MNIYQPYTYLIGWSQHNKFYYGCQYGKNANPDNLWTSYFTSSKIVNQFRKLHGEPDVVEIRFISSKNMVLRCEERVHKKLDVANSDQWLNVRNGNKDCCVTKWSRQKLSISKTGKKIGPRSAETRLRQSEAQKGKSKTEEHKAAMRKPKKKGYVQTDEHKYKRLKGRCVQWKITTPSGNDIIISNLSKFCRDNDLVNGSANMISRWSYKGYKAVRL